MKLINKIVVLLFIVVIMFQDFLCSFNEVFRYTDDFLGVVLLAMAMVVFVNRLRLSNGKLKINRQFLKVFLAILFIFVLGLLANLIYKYQQFIAIAYDMLSFFKFWLVFLLVYYLYDIYFKDLLKYLNVFAKIVTILLFIMLICDFIYDIFPKYEYRFGLPAEQLIFYHPTFLAANSIFLLVINTWALLKKKTVFHFILLVMNIVTIFFSLRIKAIGFLFIYFFVLFFFVLVSQKKIKLRYWIVIAAGLIFIAYDQIDFYILNTEVARGALTQNSFRIAGDYFPLGTGFGTFATAASGLYDYYSPVYSLYNLQNMYGIARSSPGYLSDVFWPSILGEFGFIGLFLYFGLLYFLYDNLNDIKDRKYFFIGIISLAYLLVASTSECAFYASYSVLFGLLIAIALAEGKRANNS